MNVLIVFAHPNPHSFNQAILEVVDTTLREHGHATRIHDLYQMQFRAVMDSDDLARNWCGDLPEDTLQEQIALRWAQGLVFIYPIWWFGPPAILKGWIDRVFTRKFAFEFTATGGMRGLLTQERALIINTLGGDEALYQRERWHELLVRPMTDGILGACGVRNVIHRAFYEVPTVTHIERQAMLDEVRELATAF
ncbi:NAD(P)H-dependent oxidoreductase [Candidatus Contendibacter odensensis]|uniref:NAD(P)H dehydrogenase (Quinone) n=1 Tax=Candidatus Contendobacter odensis Run_B_J11 TaxID=1400861 RepID=A0A7U7J319_9GAMM|nr:NAD(P)H-dependent oxidoreductase [Candidatus Contendobacter odensis]CDH45604.1 putative NAD(P)H dehydrogenase (Quinone) [Candidatus Contendobacter odensis Run_B_J11]